MFSYPVCRACHVNLPPAACRVDGLHAALKRQTSSFHLHQDLGSSHIRGQTTLLACNRPRLPCPEFLGFTDDREIVLRSANLACTAQLRPWSKGSPNRRVPLYQRSNQGRSRESLVDGRGTCRPASSSVWCQGSSYSPQSFQYAVALDRAPSEVTRSACVPACM